MNTVEVNEGNGWVEYAQYDSRIVASRAMEFFVGHKGKNLMHNFFVHPEAINPEKNLTMSGFTSVTIPYGEYRLV